VTKTLVVTTCQDCPAYNRGYDESTCNHPDSNQDEPIVLAGHEGTPDWCPLRAEPLHIHLKPQVPE
jgi:hypothetical protein